MRRLVSFMVVLTNDESLSFRDYSAEELHLPEDAKIRDLSKRRYTLAKRRYASLSELDNKNILDPILLDYRRALTVRFTVYDVDEAVSVYERLTSLDFVEKVKVETKRILTDQGDNNE